MGTEGKLRIADVFVGISDPRQAKKVGHDLVELLVVAICRFMRLPCKRRVDRLTARPSKVDT